MRIDRVNADAVVAIIAAEVRYAAILRFIVFFYKIDIAESVYLVSKILNDVADRCSIV